MTTKAEISPAPDQGEASDIIWGCENIARIVNRTPSQTFYLLAKGRLPARKIGDQWAASKRRLLEAVTA